MSNRFPSKTIPQSACRLTAPFTQGSLPSIQHHKKLPAQFPRRVCTGSCYFAEYFSAKDITLSHRDLFHFMLFVRESKGRKKTVRWTVFSPREIPMPRSRKHWDNDPMRLHRIISYFGYGCFLLVLPSR